MAEKKSMGALMKDGVLGQNPILRLALGVTPALAATTTAANGLGMGLTAACVLILTCLFMGIVGSLLHEKGRWIVALVVGAAFASVAQMVLAGWFPALNAALGLYAPMIAVSSLILCRGGSAAERGAGAALAEGVGMGIGYAAALTLLGAVRELIGRGTLFGAAVLPGYQPLLLAAMPAGGFLALGIAMGIANAVSARRGGKEV